MLGSYVLIQAGQIKLSLNQLCTCDWRSWIMAVQPISQVSVTANHQSDTQSAAKQQLSSIPPYNHAQLKALSPWDSLVLVHIRLFSPVQDCTVLLFTISLLGTCFLSGDLYSLSFTTEV